MISDYMTYNEAYRYLNGINNIDKIILRYFNKAEGLRSCLLPGAVRYDQDRVQTSPEDKMIDIVSEIYDIEQRIEACRKKKADMIIKISEAIEQLKNENEKTVLSSFFIAGESVRDIAKEINYSEPRVYQFRKSGINHLKQYLEDYKNYN